MTKYISKAILSMMLATLMAVIATPVLAKVTAEEAAKLKTELTPVGAERAGNKEGTIPAWTGGLQKAPENITFKHGGVGQQHPNPYAEDKILFTISAENVDQYKDKLSDGILKLFELYPDTWKMHIYPTRRPAAFSEDMYESIYENALTAEIIDKYGSVSDFYQGFTFPIPSSENGGMEAITNHLLRPFGAGNVKSGVDNAVVYSSGKYECHEQHHNFFYMNEILSKEEFDPTGYLFGGVMEPQQPGRKGELVLIKFRGNYTKGDVGAWTYLPGTRRVRRAPNFFYDGMDASSYGLACMDDSWMFIGKLDRFDWKLEGKKELFIPYNAYDIDLLPEMDPICTPNHPNPELLRWELHRVWKTVATLREGERHVYGRRIFYQDEDSWQIVLKDQYEKRGTLWRMAFANTKQFYDVPAFRQTQYMQFDFQVDFWVAGRFSNGMPAEDYTPIPMSFFTVKNLRKMGRR